MRRKARRLLDLRNQWHINICVSRRKRAEVIDAAHCLGCNTTGARFRMAITKPRSNGSRPFTNRITPIRQPNHSRNNAPVAPIPGVHALGQVVHFDVPFERDTHAWVRRGERILPETIAVRWARVVEASFSCAL